MTVRIEEVIGRNLRQIREGKDLSQTDLGQAMEQHLGKPWSRQAVSAAEKGRRFFTAADLLGLARALDVSIPHFFMLTDWRDENAVELVEGVSVPAAEYRDRILHEVDARGSAQLMTTADLQELGDAVVKMRENYAKAGAALAGLEVGVVYAAKAVKLADEATAEQLAQRLGEQSSD
ncbi:helix-turn-helix domain-containing protein [Streptomyces sp. NPDC056632]|uniref:helix-turn-helix domain-containing protein n=1 Tax=Streptomyces sp. NPDC056632 TaxID=3345884 RepID=UPI003697C902